MPLRVARRLMIELYWMVLPKLAKLVFKFVDSFSSYHIPWQIVPCLDRSLVNEVCMDSSYSIFWCIQKQLEVVFSTGPVTRIKGIGQSRLIIHVECLKSSI